MGHLRFNELALNDVVNEASYKKYDLSEAGKLSALILKVGEQVSTSLLSSEGRVPDHITKLEVMGKRDKTIKSYRGLDCHGIYAHRTGRMPPHLDDMAGSMFNYEEFIIMFGRYIGDPKLYLDLSKDPDVDLKITNDFDVTTYWTDGQLKYTLHEIFLPPETPPEQGYIRSYEHSYWAAVTGATKSKKLTPGFKVFDVLLRGPCDVTATTGVAATNIYNVLREISVDFKNKTEVVLDSIEVRDLMFIIGQMYGGPWHNIGIGYEDTSGHEIDSFIGYKISDLVSDYEGVSADTYLGTTKRTEPRIRVHLNAARHFHWAALGFLPYNSLMLPFDLGWPGVPLLDTEAKKPVYIRVKSNTDNGDVYMVVEELGKL